MMYSRTLTHLRDFLSDEELKQMPGTFQAGTFMLLKQSRGGKGNIEFVACEDCKKRPEYHPLCESCTKLYRKWELEKGSWKQVLQVFDAAGNWIGEITNPDWIPSGKL